MSVQDSESRRFEQTIDWVFLRPILAQDRPRNYFFGVLEKFETFFSKICAHSDRCRNLLAGIVDILTFYGNIAFPLSPVYDSTMLLVWPHEKYFWVWTPNLTFLSSGPPLYSVGTSRRGALYTEYAADVENLLFLAGLEFLRKTGCVPHYFQYK